METKKIPVVMRSRRKDFKGWNGKIALAYIMQQKFEAFPIVTMTNNKRIADNVDAVNIKLTEKEIEIIAR